MAEALATSATVIAIIQISDRLIGLCKYYIETVQDASTDLRAILIETSTLKTILESLTFITSCRSGASTVVNTLSGEDGPIEGCLRAITRLEKMFPQNIHQAKDENHDKRRKVKATWAALAWPLKEKQAKKLLDEIMRYKSTIALTITTESTYALLPLSLYLVNFFVSSFKFSSRNVGVSGAQSLHACL